ncbi:MAG: hypothetical protein O4859_29850 [Trichodesmium sp. St18_bin1]|nr:hypothetical protein [Trichodesmium sp. St18_bin1]MDE5119973.1 hypothetical protein [Trichodesmium sp. St19_bin1]
MGISWSRKASAISFLVLALFLGNYWNSLTNGYWLETGAGFFWGQKEVTAIYNVAVPTVLIQVCDRPQHPINWTTLH